MSEIRSDLKPYVPASFYDGANLKAGVSTEEATKVAEGIRAAVRDLPDAQAKIFLEMLSSPDLAPGGRVPENIGETIGALAGVMQNIGAGTPFEDSVKVLARLLIQQAAENRKDALQDRLASREMAKTELLTQAQASMDQADKLESGAKSALIVSCVFSAISIAASVVSIAGNISAGRQATAFVNAGGKAENFQATGFAATGQAVGGMGNTIGQSGQAGAGYATSEAQAKAKEYEAQGQIASAQAQELQNQADLRKEMMDSMGDTMKAIIAFLKDMQDAEAEAMRAVTRG